MSTQPPLYGQTRDRGLQVSSHTHTVVSAGNRPLIERFRAVKKWVSLRRSAAGGLNALQTAAGRFGTSASRHALRGAQAGCIGLTAVRRHKALVRPQAGSAPPPRTHSSRQPPPCPPRPPQSCQPGGGGARGWGASRGRRPVRGCRGGCRGACRGACRAPPPTTGPPLPAGKALTTPARIQPRLHFWLL